MPKQFIDWSDWKPGQGQPEHPLSQPLKKGMTGAESVAKALSTGQLPEMGKAKPQPTNQEMFGHLVVTEEEMKKKEDDWKNASANAFKKMNEAMKSIEDKVNLNKTAWKGRGSYQDEWREEFGEEYIAQRNLHVGDE